MRSGATLLPLGESRRRGRFRFEVELKRIGSRRVTDDIWPCEVVRGVAWVVTRDRINVAPRSRRVTDDIWPCEVVRGVAWVVTRDRINVAPTRGSSKRLGQAAGGR